MAKPELESNPKGCRNPKRSRTRAVPPAISSRQGRFGEAETPKERAAFPPAIESEANDPPNVAAVPRTIRPM